MTATPVTREECLNTLSHPINKAFLTGLAAWCVLTFDWGRGHFDLNALWRLTLEFAFFCAIMGRQTVQRYSRGISSVFDSATARAIVIWFGLALESGLFFYQYPRRLFFYPLYSELVWYQKLTIVAVAWKALTPWAIVPWDFYNSARFVVGVALSIYAGEALLMQSARDHMLAIVFMGIAFGLADYSLIVAAKAAGDNHSALHLILIDLPLILPLVIFMFKLMPDAAGETTEAFLSGAIALEMVASTFIAALIDCGNLNLRSAVASRAHAQEAVTGD